jgi:hypothetical protein
LTNCVLRLQIPSEDAIYWCNGCNIGDSSLPLDCQRQDKRTVLSL